jgi:hypothetical protein
MNLKDYIKHYDLIDPRLVSKLIKFANKINYEEAQTVGGLNKQIRNVEEHHLSNKLKSLTAVKWFNLISYFIIQACNKYTQDLKNLNNDCLNLNEIETINLLKYKKNYFYKKHIDHGAVTPRTVSVIIFLNNDYKGGSLCFDINGEILKIAPAVGRILIWPSNFLYPHFVEPVTEGTRYVLVSWLI